MRELLGVHHPRGHRPAPQQRTSPTGSFTAGSTRTSSTRAHRGTLGSTRTSNSGSSGTSSFGKQRHSSNNRHRSLPRRLKANRKRRMRFWESTS
ncbi:hypothetical protein ACFXCR_08750 [Streptomyces sp. NPDC059431]|uniref:hypothetical protein n=1 Tax=Streptomyces sp. NPDC059431 TaxID=3346828 RepID=UPI0036B74539